MGAAGAGRRELGLRCGPCGVRGVNWARGKEREKKSWARAGLAARPDPGLLVGMVTGLGRVAENWFGSSNSLPLFYSISNSNSSQMNSHLNLNSL